MKNAVKTPATKTKIKIPAVICICLLSVIVVAAAVIGGLSWHYGYFILNPQLSIVVVGEAEIELEVFSKYADEGATAYYGHYDISNEITVEGDVDTSVPGEYVITYLVGRKKMTSTAVRTVHIVDKTVPEITLEGEKEITLSSAEFFEEPGFSATDNVDGDITDKVKVTKTEKDRKCIITYTVSDSSKNTASETRILIIKDVVAPKITLKGKSDIYITVGSSFSDPGASASDDVDGNITSKISKSGSVDTSKTGTYKITYKVTDSGGNTASVTRKVTVYKPDTSSGNKNRIYLTFDDGPSSNVTVRILDILKKNGMKATFFICNYSDSEKSIIKRMIDEGHTVAIHGYSHDYAAIYKSDEAFMENINKLRDKLKSDFGYEAKFIRFPGGSSNTVSRKYSKGIMTRLSSRVEEEGYTYFDWNVSSDDATANKVSADTIYNKVCNSLAHSRNNVVLFHDSGSKQTTADALQNIIDYGLANGYVFLPITESTVPVQHKINN